jgi:hypothetical protein
VRHALGALAWVIVALGSPGLAAAQPGLGLVPPPEDTWPRFECEDGVCPAGVGALLVHHADGEVGFCTATLVSRNRVVTAAHCVGAILDPTHFFLPDERAITVVFRSVVRVIHDQVRARGADHAILELDRPIDAPARVLARSILEPDGALSIVRATPHDDRTVFLRRERCRVMPQALIADRLVPSAIVRVAGCTILPGNSGAPMLDHQGRVVAIVSTALEPRGVAMILAPWLRGAAPFVGTVSSLACLPRGLAPGVPPAACSGWSRAPDPGTFSSAEARHAAADAETEALTEQLVHWDVRGDAVEWELEHQIEGDRILAVPVPGCIDVAELERTRRIDRRGRFSLSMEVPAWEASALLGEDVRMVPQTRRIARLRLDIRGRFDELRQRAEVRIRARGAARPRPRAETTVSACETER